MLVLTARLRRALLRIGGIDCDDMFIHMVLVHVVEMAVMEIIDVAVMEDRRMPAVGTMLVSMVGMMFLGAGGHSTSLLGLRYAWKPASSPPATCWLMRTSMSKQKCRPAHRIEQTIVLPEGGVAAHVARSRYRKEACSRMSSLGLSDETHHVVKLAEPIDVCSARISSKRSPKS
jgi:hypothetical protein